MGDDVRPPEAAPWRAEHHVGMTVADIDRSLAFRQGLLGTSARWRGVLDAPNLGTVLGAQPVSAGPVAIIAGPNQGAHTGYLRTPDGVTLELFQAAASATG